MENRQWIYNRNLPGRTGIRQEFLAGVAEFINFASNQYQFMNGDQIRCPCYRCKNRKFLNTADVVLHLYRRGFTENYWNWVAHGEAVWAVNEHDVPDEQLPEQIRHWGEYEHMNWDQRMVYDSARPSFVPSF